MTSFPECLCKMPYRGNLFLQRLPRSLCISMATHLCIEDAFHSGVTATYRTRKTYTTDPDAGLMADARAVRWTDSMSQQGFSAFPRKCLCRRHIY